MPTLTDISTLIVSTPDTCGGRPRIADTRITVQYIVNEIKSGMTPEEIIYTALAYYYANKESLDIEFARYQEECQRLEAEYKTGHLS
jgi:hypoxanthine phosphoribosyltransferase